MSSAIYKNFDGVTVAAGTGPSNIILQSTVKAGATVTGTKGADQLPDVTGGDTLVGGAGNDTYLVTDLHTTVVEQPNGGTDIVRTYTDYTLPANVEEMDISTPNVTGTSNSAGGLLLASGYRNTVVSGAGKDVMVDNGQGGDTFSFSQGSGKDVIYNFKTAGTDHDYIQLKNFGFTTFAQVQSHLTQQGADVLLTLDASDAVLIRNTKVSDLTATDFELPIDTSKMTLTFDDEFNSLSINNGATGTWKTSLAWGPANGGGSLYGRNEPNNGEKQAYTDVNATGLGTKALGINPFSISNGVLSITAAKTPAADVSTLYGLPYTSGILTTQNSFSQEYGYFEIRAEIPSEQGTFPAFWMLPADGTWPPEADIFEAVNGSGMIPQSYVTNQTGTASSQSFWSYVPDASTSFHTYGLLWTKDTLTYYVDGVATATTATPADMNKPMYMLVNLAMAGYWSGPTASDFTTASLKVDYIRAYSLSSTAASDPTTATPTTPSPSPTTVTPTSMTPPAAGADVVYSATNMTLGRGAHTLVLTGTGNTNGTANNLGDNIYANSGKDRLTGGSGNDTFFDGSGMDTFIGGGGKDTFVFGVHNGHDTINDMTKADHDVIDISAYLAAGYARPTLQEVGSNTELIFSTGDTIMLLGVHPSDLVATSVGYTI